MPAPPISPPPLSVVMPVYNGEKYLAQSLRSIGEQTFGDYEFIIVNDGSTDGTRAMLEAAAARDARIVLINQANKGVPAASNAGIARARADLIARMDADDVSMPDRFARQLEYFRRHPECVALGTAVLMVDAEGDPIRNYFVPLEHEEIDAALFNTWAMFQSTAMIRREALVRLGGYREEFATLEDLDIFLRLGEIGRLANLAEPLGQYRLHAKSLSHSSASRMNSLVGKVLDEAQARRGRIVPDALPVAVSEDLGPEQLQMMWAWWAHDAGNYATARKHGLRLVARRPWSAARWKLLMCALRGQWRKRDRSGGAA